MANWPTEMLISWLHLTAQQKNSPLLPSRKKLADLCMSSIKRLEQLLQRK
jgi:hypothetical protein